MITIFNSTSVRTTSTAQDLLNDLANATALWGEGWTRVPETGDVTQLWVSSSIYFSLSSDSTPKLKITKEIEGAQDITKTYSTAMSTYSIVTTDKGILVTNGTVYNTSGMWFAIGNTTAPNNTISRGVFLDFESGSFKGETYTDNMSTTTNSYYSSQYSWGKSTENTVLAPLYSITGDEKFDDLMLVVLSKATDAGKVVLNNKYYYINEAIALPYTPT